jgi:hypothetical protein
VFLFINLIYFIYMFIHNGEAGCLLDNFSLLSEWYVGGDIGTDIQLIGEYHTNPGTDIQLIGEYHTNPYINFRIISDNYNKLTNQGWLPDPKDNLFFQYDSEDSENEEYSSLIDKYKLFSSEKEDKLKLLEIDQSRITVKSDQNQLLDEINLLARNNSYIDAFDYIRNTIINYPYFDSLKPLIGIFNQEFSSRGNFPVDYTKQLGTPEDNQTSL